MKGEALAKSSGGKQSTLGVLIAAVISITGLAVAHEIKLAGDPLPGSGYSAGAVSPVEGKVLDFPAENVTLMSWLTSEDLTGEVQEANDIWGYVSPSGREYAIVGLFRGTAFVEVTDPEQPRVIKFIGGPGSIWRDIAVYRQFAYIVNETGGGVQVVDLRKIDRGKVRKRASVTAGGLATAHNISVNPASGYAYLSGSNLAGGGLVALDLSSPARPELEVGAWAEHYVHDALVVTFTKGPRAGREIAFAFAAESGVQIVDVTDKDDMFTVANVRYPGLAYCHSGWIDRKERFLLVNDELDELHEAESDPERAKTRTYVINVKSLEQARHVKTISHSVTSIDHNTMVRGKRLFAANYQSGFRVFDARRPKKLREIGHFDTHPEADAVRFAGAWGVFSDFPSGIVVVSDINRGLFVFDPSASARAPGS